MRLINQNDEPALSRLNRCAFHTFMFISLTTLFLSGSYSLRHYSSDDEERKGLSAAIGFFGIASSSLAIALSFLNRPACNPCIKPIAAMGFFATAAGAVGLFFSLYNTQNAISTISESPVSAPRR